MPDWRHRVTTAEAGVRLDRFLEGRLGELTRSQVKRLVDRGLVRVEGRAAKAGHPLKSGEMLEVELPDVSPPSLVPQDHPFEILHEDVALLVIAKPAGLAVHPGAGRPGGTLVNALLARKHTAQPHRCPVSSRHRASAGHWNERAHAGGQGRGGAPGTLGSPGASGNYAAILGVAMGEDRGGRR